MAFAKDSMDVVLQSSEDERDIEVASTVTATPSSIRDEKRNHSSDFKEPLLRMRRKAQRQNRYITYGFFSTLWILSLIAMSWITTNLQPLIKYSYETGFDTDLEPLRSQIAIKKVKFTGGLKFDDNGTTYRSFDPNETQYVGEPSPKLDRAWRSLIRGQAVDLRGEEAESVADITYQKPGGWYLTGPDAFHQLHCLDVLRRALRPDHYTPPNTPDVHMIHLDHCIDYIRQGIMCAGDLTMIPVEWSTKRNRILQQTEVVHTCRDFEKIHAWTLARDAEAHRKQGWDE